MTSKLTREFMQNIISGHGFGVAPSAVKAMAEYIVAAMDSEPVGEFYEDGPLNWYQISDGDRVPAHRRIPLYRHAQQPVVPDSLIAAVNRLLDSDGSRGCYSAIQCGDAHDEIERMLAAAPQEVKGE
ncbi:hypothetical protein ACNHKA_10790 [Klebsiella michiganensis]